MSKREPSLYLQDIITSITKIEEYIKGLSFEEFSKNDKTVDAVVRNLEIIGEAARNIPQEIAVKYPDIAWGKMISMRNKVMHGYFGVDMEIVWKTINEDLPELQEKLKTLFELSAS
ncbi:DUF86 domain-containing protein [Candidatus Daviesbacteria bacterium]|nr:DUF86 domain-containing protein [Candidatus Daviesbacteria bacterium]